MVFGRGYRRHRASKPAQLTTNHCQIPVINTIGGTTSQTFVFTAVEPPTNRGDHIPASALLKGVKIELWGDSGENQATDGLHRCMLTYGPAATAYADPIASWLSTADPLTEEAIQVRQQKMGRMRQYVNINNAVRSAYWMCAWKGAISLRDGDHIVLSLFDENDTRWRGLCSAWWIA